MHETLASKGFIVFGLYHNDLNGKYPGPLSFRLMEIAATVRKLVQLNGEIKGEIKGEIHDEINGFFCNRLSLTHGIGLHGHSLGK